MTWQSNVFLRLKTVVCCFAYCTRWMFSRALHPVKALTRFVFVGCFTLPCTRCLSTLLTGSKLDVLPSFDCFAPVRCYLRFVSHAWYGFFPRFTPIEYFPALALFARFLAPALFCMFSRAWRLIHRTYTVLSCLFECFFTCLPPYLFCRIRTREPSLYCSRIPKNTTV